MCTGVLLTASDEKRTTIAARTMEFEDELYSQIIVVPAGTRYPSFPAARPRKLEWTAKYGAVGANAFHTTLLVEGLNDQGLSAGAFYFPGYAHFTHIDHVPGGKALSPLDVVTWLLTTCATLDEVAKAVSTTPVAVFSGDGGTDPDSSTESKLPLHYRVCDRDGRSLVIEYTHGGAPTVYENEIGVFTNSPPFDWQSTNLKNYINLGPTNVEQSSVLRIPLTQIGQGTGLLGIPGDFTPPSRFVRAAFYAATAQPGSTPREAVQQAFHILNLFDIPLGTCQGSSGEDYTEWTSACDMTNLVFYIRTHDNQQVRYVDVLPALAAAQGVVHIGLNQDEQYVNLTPATPQTLDVTGAISGLVRTGTGV